MQKDQNQKFNKLGIYYCKRLNLYLKKIVILSMELQKLKILKTNINLFLLVDLNSAKTIEIN